MQPLLTFKRGRQDGILIAPRWPSRRVQIDPIAWTQLQAVQAGLPCEIHLILTRAYEPKGGRLNTARQLFRAAGIALFRLIYPSRCMEIADIFGANGHDTDGTHLDVSILLDRKRLRLLPLGVFTPRAWQKQRVSKYQAAVAQVKDALVRHGFQLHRNATESLQIHCDLIANQPAL